MNTRAEAMVCFRIDLTGSEIKKLGKELRNLRSKFSHHCSGGSRICSYISFPSLCSALEDKVRDMNEFRLEKDKVYDLGNMTFVYDDIEDCLECIEDELDEQHFPILTGIKDALKEHFSYSVVDQYGL